VWYAQWWSEFGNLRLSQGHDRLHVRLEKAGDHAVVQLAIFRCLELHFVNVTILVADRTRRKLVALRETLDDGHHLRSQLLQHAPIGKVEKATRTLPEIPALVQALIVQAQLLQSEYLDPDFKNRLDCQVFELGICEALFGHLEGHVDQMQPRHAPNIKCKDFILLLLFRSRAGIDHSADLFDRLSSSCGQGSFDVLETLELGDRRGTAP